MWRVLRWREEYREYWNERLLVIYRSLRRAFVLDFVIKYNDITDNKVNIRKIINSDPFGVGQMI